MRFRTARTGRLPAAARRDHGDLIALAYELLDAHADTQRLAGAPATEAEWESHLIYLRDLQRVGREILARAAGDPLPGSNPAAPV
jgi:hypothetical protein